MSDLHDTKSSHRYLPIPEPHTPIEQKTKKDEK